MMMRAMTQKAPILPLATSVTTSAGLCDLKTMKNSIDDGEDRVLARRHERLAAGRGRVRVGLAAGDEVGRVGQHDLLIAPDDAPHVEHHDGAEQHAGA